MLLTAAEFEETVVAVQREPGELHPLAHDRDVAPEVGICSHVLYRIVNICILKTFSPYIIHLLYISLLVRRSEEFAKIFVKNI